MKQISKVTGRASSIPKGLAWGGGVSVILTLMFAALFAKLVDLEKMTWENVGYGVMCTLLLSSFLGAEAAVLKIKRQRMIVCILSGLTYFCILLSITALFFGGQYEGLGVTLLLIIAGSGCAGILGIRKKGSGRNGKRPSHYR